MPYLTNTVSRRIQWGECDPAGIVFYPRYFEIFDGATTAMFSAGTGLTKYQMFETYKFAGYPMVDTRARFLIPCRFGDDVMIETTMTEAKRSSFNIASSEKRRRARGSRRSRRVSGLAAIRPTPRRSSLSRSRPKCSRSFPVPDAPFAAVHDFLQQRDQPVAPVLADPRDHPALVRLDHGLELAHQRGAVGGEIERIRPLVARLPPLGEAALPTRRACRRSWCA